MLKISQKMSSKKKIKSFYKSFYYFKASVTVLNEFFIKFLFIGLVSNYFKCFHDILKIQLYKQILQF
jgi:hypothetical protein